MLMTEVLGLPAPAYTVGPFTEGRELTINQATFSVSRRPGVIYLQQVPQDFPEPAEFWEELDVADTLRQTFTVCAEYYQGGVDAADRMQVTVPTEQTLNDPDIFTRQGLGVADLSFRTVESTGKDGATRIVPYLGNLLQGVASLSDDPKTYVHDVTVHFPMRYLPAPSFEVFQALGADAFDLRETEPEAGEEYLILLGDVLDSITGQAFPNLNTAAPSFNVGLITAFRGQVRQAAFLKQKHYDLIDPRVGDLLRRVPVAGLAGENILHWENRNWALHYGRAATRLAAQRTALVS